MRNLRAPAHLARPLLTGLAGLLVAAAILCAGTVGTASAGAAGKHRTGRALRHTGSRDTGAGGYRPFVAVQVLIADGAHPLPVVGAHVRIVPLSGGGRETIAAGRTYSRGLALVEARPGRAIPTRFQVRVSGGFVHGGRFKGTLYSREDSYSSARPETIVVNLATTLAAMYCARHPRLTTTSCEARTSWFLQLGRFGAGGDLSTQFAGDRALDGRMVLRAARRAGGLTHLLGALSAEMGTPRARSTSEFHARSLPSGTRALSGLKRRSSHSRGRARGGHRGMAHAAVFPEEPLEDVSMFKEVLGFAEKASGAIKLVKSFSELFNLVSGNNAKAQAELTEVHKGIVELQESITEMRAELKALSQAMKNFETEVRHGEYSQLAAAAAEQVQRVYANVSAYEAVTNEAAQIACGDYSTAASAEHPSCKDPEAPSRVCSKPASTELRKACVHLGDLPVPAEQRFYTEPGAPKAAKDSLIGNFVRHISGEDRLEGSDVTTLANKIAGGLGGDAPGAEGIWQAGSAWFAEKTPLLSTATDSQIQHLVTYYLSAYTAGMVMVAYYDAFNQIPESTYESEVEAMLAGFKDLAAAAPQKLPAGTFIDTHTGLMWSGQLGSVTAQPTYMNLLYGGEDIQLPFESETGGNRPNNATGAPTPKLANGKIINTWRAADYEQLEGLITDAPLHTLIKEGLFAGQVLSNTWPAGLTFNSWQQGGVQEFSKSACASVEETAGCVAPTWAAGEGQTGMFDLHSGKGMGSYISINGNNNWWDPAASYEGEEPNEAEEETPFVIPSFIGTVDLPVLYNREAPSESAEECYYYAGPKGGGCKG